ncbi:conserved phage C-terminal domain-containing protein [Metabacillus sp. GX 13764]|uniref:conserved phage C-terminal domain-containing protein n=1 Tax=Metabacillus kandeliae TaxID=2900151 RepID=UPI001E439570|nr:conserved phage C-terminal domain-containing protein [Metabacillus kandeliae]MCD7034332.1 conserved phage C-terminal domain-containing protein [Metabacillus kandeliae]
MQGWIKLHREVRSNWLYQEKRTFSKFEAWVDLLLEVNHKDNKVLLGSELLEVKRGSTITSIRQLCDRWGWSNTKVKQFLGLLENDGMITVKSDTKKTVITVDKYDFYQCGDEEKTTEKHHDNDTEATQKHTNKNVKNDKNENIYAVVINHLNEKAGTNFKSTTKKTREFINARLNENFSKEDLLLVIDYCCEHWKGKTFNNGNKGDDYLQPSTLFNNKFDERLQKALKADEEPKKQPRRSESGGGVLEQFWGNAH